MAKKKNRIGFAVVGCGHIGARHAEMIRANKEAELITVCDIDPYRGLAISKLEANYCKWYDELFTKEMDKGIEVVNICTPNGLHAEHAIKALKHKKHVVIEKPMALTSSDCKRIIAEAKRASRRVFCVMQNRYSPPAVWIKQVVEKGLLGKIYMVQVNCFWNRDERYYTGKDWKGTSDLDGGTLFTQFSHFVDMLYWLFGDITDIHARFSDFNHKKLTSFEDSGMVMFRFVKGGGTGSISYSTSVWDKNMESSITIIAENGSVKVGGQYMNEVEYCHINNYKMPKLKPSNHANDYGAYKGSAANHHYIIENVIDTLKGRTKATTNAADGLKVVDMIERIYKQKK